MKIRVALVSLVASLQVGLVAEPGGAIVGGNPDGDGHPNVGLLAFDPDGAGGRPPIPLCTGSVLADDVFLTAAHCITAPFVPPGSQWVVTLEAGGPSDTVYEPGFFPEDFPVPVTASVVRSTGAAVHPRFDPRSGKNDVAVVLFSGAPFHGVDPVSLPRTREASRVRIWDWRSGEIVHEIPTVAVGLAFDPEAERIATAEAWGQLGHVWDVATEELLVSLRGHTGFLWDIEFAPDGATLATASWDGTVRLWDADSGRQNLTLRGHESVAFQATFTPDGSRLASSSTDGTARVWALDLDDLIQIANRKLARGLTDEECRQYLHVRTCPAGSGA